MNKLPLKTDEDEALELAEAEAQQARDSLVDHYLEFDDAGNFINSPKTDDELWEFIWCAFGFKIPRKIMTEGHRSPMDFISDLFFERVDNALGFANRTGGKTRAVAIINVLDMVFKPACEIASAGAVIMQAQRCFGYVVELLEMSWQKRLTARWEAKFGHPFVTKTNVGNTVIATDSTLEILTATDKGLRSPHPHKARIDEVDAIPWEIFQVGLSMAKSKMKNKKQVILGQNVFTSTRQNEHGTMQKLLSTAKDKGIEVYEWNIWEALETCTRRCFNDPKHGDCPVYERCRGKAHDCDGFYSIRDFINKVRLIDPEGFKVEWLNESPSKDKLVYPMFDRKRHVVNAKKLIQIAGSDTIRPEWPRICGVDFGSSPGHPFVYLKLCWLPCNAWMICYEYVAEQKVMRDHAKAIKGSPNYLAGDRIFSDWTAQDRLELKDNGVYTYQAIKDVNMGIDCVQECLQGFLPENKPLLYVWHECTTTIEEFEIYQWPVKPDGTVDKTSGPCKWDDHCLDALRYALYSYKKSAKGSKYHSRYVAGV